MSLDHTSANDASASVATADNATANNASTSSTPANSPQVRRAMQAIHAATWFALCQGDRYSALGRKSVANSFYNLLPMLAEVRKAVLDERDPNIETVEVIDGMSEVVSAVAVGGALPGPRRLHAVSETGDEGRDATANDAQALVLPGTRGE